MMNTDCLGIHDVILFYGKYKLLTLNITLIVYN